MVEVIDGWLEISPGAYLCSAGIDQPDSTTYLVVVRAMALKDETTHER